MGNPVKRLMEPVKTLPEPQILPPIRKAKKDDPQNRLALAVRETATKPVRIAEQTIKKLKPPATGYRIKWDSEIKGFGARITAAGTISFILDYRVPGHHRRYTIGKFGDDAWSATAARIKAAELKAKMEKTKEDDRPFDPMETRQQLSDADTVDDLVKKYKESASFQELKAHTQRDYARMLDKKISPDLGRYPLKSIGKHDIETLRTSLRDTPYQANRVLSLLSKMFNFAIEDGSITKNPVKGVKKYHEERREKWLSAEGDIKKFSKALDDYPHKDAANCLRLLLLTGARPGEALKATWSEFDLEKGEWTKPSHHTKQKTKHKVQLSDPAIALLRRMKPKNATGPLFPSESSASGHLESLRRPWLQACKAAGLVTVEEVRGKRRHKVLKYKPTLPLYSLRHSFASLLASNGVGLQVIGDLMGHVLASTTERYTKVQEKATRAAANKLAEVIEFEFKKGA